ncbi:TPA: hypothetical protein ACH3X2_000960 [Trebouxia sp. C0005]
MSSTTSTCKLEYDSDEDRHAAYLSSLQARRACQSHAQQQRKLLQRYRQQQDTQQQQDDNVAERFKFCAAEAPSQFLRPDNDHHTSHTSCEDSPAHRAQKCTAWAQHETRWRKIEDGSEYIQSLQAIPWPPFSAGTLHCMAGGCHCSDNHLNTTKCCTLLSHCSQAADQLRVMALITAVYRVLERKHICLLHSVFSD